MNDRLTSVTAWLAFAVSAGNRVYQVSDVLCLERVLLKAGSQAPLQFMRFEFQRRNPHIMFPFVLNNLGKLFCNSEILIQFAPRLLWKVW